MSKKPQRSELDFEMIRRINLDMDLSTTGIDALIEAEKNEELFALCLAALSNCFLEEPIATAKH